MEAKAQEDEKTRLADMKAATEKEKAQARKDKTSFYKMKN